MSQSAEEKITLLVVDDETKNRLLVESILSDDNYELYMAECGMEALLLAEGIEPDLILLDVMMPDMDGYEVCREIRQRPNLTTIPIIMITALDGRDSMLKGLEAGADEFLTKPIDALELRTRVRTVAKLNRVRRLQREREEFAMIAEDARDGYLRVDQNGIITYLNNVARRLLGPDSRGLLSSLSRRFSLEPAVAWQNWDAICQHPESVRYLLLPTSVSSRARWFQFQVKPPAVSDRTERLCRIIDVSHLMHTKRDIWSFQSAVCHKLRTPLTGIIAVTDMLKQRKDDPELWQLLESSTQRLESQVVSVTKLVEYPRDLAHGTANHMDLVSAIRSAAEATGIRRLDENIQTPAQISVELSEAAAEVIATALFENSVRFHPQNSPIVTIHSRYTEKQVIISFVDDGVHVPVEDLDRLGSVLFQSESSFTGEVPGMGIGLSMVDSILREQNGELSVSNRPDGPGVAVTVSLARALSVSRTSNHDPGAVTDIRPIDSED